MIYSH